MVLRDLHLYLGLFVSPFVLLYAVSTVLINHTLLPWGGDGRAEVERRRFSVAASEETSNLQLAAQILRQVDVSGEIMYVRDERATRRLVIPVERPGHKITVRADLTTGTAEIEREDTGAWDALVFLHTMPGPHNADIRGNWLVTRLWGWLADATIYLILFVTASGVYLWTAVRAERRNGVICLGAGAVSFLLIVMAIVP